MIPQPEPEFVPPYPLRPDHLTAPMRLLQRARLNYLTVFGARDFSSRIIFLKVLRRQIVVCNGPGFLKQVFLADHDLVHRKSAQMRQSLKPLIGDGLFISDGDIWKARRKMIAPIISGPKVRGHVPVMVQTIEETSNRWKALGDGAEIDMQVEMGNLTAEVICRTVFSQALGRAYTSEIVEGFTEYQKLIDQIDLLSLLGLPDWVPRLNHIRIHRSAQRILSVLDEIIDRYVDGRIAGEGAVLDGLLSAENDDGTPLGREAIRNEAAVMFLAGQETTANTLSWAWYLVSQSPAVAARLHAEVDAVLGDRPPGQADVAKLPYTRAIIEETLRLYPPIPIFAREAQGSITVADKTFRKGTLMLAVPWLLHRSPHFWEDPAMFRPERHIEGHEFEEKRRSKYTFIPFGIGPRICAGQVFGLTEAILALAGLSRGFTPKLKAGTKVEPQCRLTLRVAGGLPMILKVRS